MPLQAGDVIRVYDHTTHPPKQKRHICVCPSRQLFLRINTNAYFPPHVLLRSDGVSFLDHDSYVELQQLIRLRAYDIAQSEVIGRLNGTQRRLILLTAEQCGALTDEHLDLIREQFG
jgi:hypothetical protein